MQKISDYDLIIMDIQMPGMDGLEVTSRIRGDEEKNGGHVPIIAMTAYTRPEDQDKIIRAGMDYYITKPINVEKLNNALDAVLGKEKANPISIDLPVDEVQKMIQRLEGNVELFEELLAMFSEDYLKDIAKLNESLNKKDTRTAAILVHGLKGELGNLGMITAYNIACELEKLAKDNQLEEAVMLSEMLEEEIKRILQFFSHPDWKVLIKH